MTKLRSGAARYHQAMVMKLAIAAISWIALIALAAYLLRRWVAPRRTVCIQSFALGGAAIAMVLLALLSLLSQSVQIPPWLDPFRILALQLGVALLAPCAGLVGMAAGGYVGYLCSRN